MVLVFLPECDLVAWVASIELASLLVECETGVVIA